MFNRIIGVVACLLLLAGLFMSLSVGHKNLKERDRLAAANEAAEALIANLNSKLDELKQSNAALTIQSNILKAPAMSLCDEPVKQPKRKHTVYRYERRFDK